MMDAVLILIWLLASMPNVAADTRTKQDDDIREAVFRYLLDRFSSVGQRSKGVFCLAVGEKGADPSGEFMTRFAKDKLAVKKRSECTADPYNGVADKNTGREGLIFHVAGMRWVSDAKVEVDGGYYEAGLSASGNTYTVVKRHGKWIVSKDTMHWIAQSYPLEKRIRKNGTV
jgi:hypothetical protein